VLTVGGGAELLDLNDGGGGGGPLPFDEGGGGGAPREAGGAIRTAEDVPLLTEG